MLIPSDPIILLSYINTQLRDNYSSYEELCKSMCLDGEKIKSKLKMVDYEYDEKLNRFM